MSGVGFNFFSNIFRRIDAAISSFISLINGNIVDYIIPAVSIGVSISLLWVGTMAVLGSINAPHSDLLKRALSYATITFIAGAGGLYQSQFADLIMTLPEDLATSLLGDSGAVSSNVLDLAAGQGFTLMGDAFNRFDLFAGATWGWAVLGTAIGFVTVIVVGIGGGFIMTAKVALGLLAALGPMFIYALLFEPLRNFFSAWLNNVVQYILLIVMFSAVFKFFMEIFSVYIKQVDLDNSGLNLWYTTGGIILLGVYTKHMLGKLPQLASALSQGTHIGTRSNNKPDSPTPSSPNPSSPINQVNPSSPTIAPTGGVGGAFRGRDTI